MKFKFKFFIVTLLLCSATIVTKAKDLSVFSVTSAGNNSFILQLTNVVQAPFEVTLKDRQGVTLYNETVMQNSLHRKYDLRELPSGNYILMVTYGTVIKIQPISKKNKILKIEPKDLQTIFPPTFRLHSDYLDLDMLLLSNLKISFEIKDEDGHVIYSELIQTKGALQKRFNLSQLDKGYYTFSLGIVDNVLIKEFKELIEWFPSIDAN